MDFLFGIIFTIVWEGIGYLIVRKQADGEELDGLDLVIVCIWPVAIIVLAATKIKYWRRK